MRARPKTWLLLTLLSLGACGGANDDGTGGAGAGAATTTSTTSNSGGSGAGGAAGGSAGAGGVIGGSGGSGGDPCAGMALERHVVSAAELFAMMQQKDFALVNVHIPYQGEIVGTDIHIPYTDVDAIEAYLDHEHGAKVVLYCYGGGMSVTAGDDLASRGYCQVYDLSGGLVAWKNAGYPFNP